MLLFVKKPRNVTSVQVKRFIAFADRVPTEKIQAFLDEENSRKNLTNMLSSNGSFTYPQFQRLADMANAHGVLVQNLESFLNNETAVKRFFQNLLPADQWEASLKASAARIGAWVHILKITVDYTIPFNDAALRGGPSTLPGYQVLQCADRYNSAENNQIEETIVTFGWKSSTKVSYWNAVEWAKENGLQTTGPLVPFAIGEQKPEFNLESIEKGKDMWLIETTGCIFEGLYKAVALFYFEDRKKREAMLFNRNGFTNSNSVFLFRR